MAKRGNVNITYNARTANFKRQVSDAERHTTTAKARMEKGQALLNTAVGRLGGIMAGAFAVDRIISFGAESIRLAGKIKGIEEAFKKLDKPTLLNELKKATRDTVSEMQLMQIAVKASNFRIPLSELATLLEFAQKRATQTGEGVDYLVDSIINGIGRKSALVLDNLGISATELQTEFKKTGDFASATGNIVRRELVKMGDVTETTTTKTEQLNAKYKDMSVKLGTLLIPIFEKGIDKADSLIDKIEGVIETINKGEISNSPIYKFLELWTKVLTASSDFGVKQIQTDFGKYAKNLDHNSNKPTEKELKNLKDGKILIPKFVQGEGWTVIIEETEKMTKKLNATFEAYGKTQKDVNNRISELRDLRKEIVVWSSEYIKNLEEEERLTKYLKDRPITQLSFGNLATKGLDAGAKPTDQVGNRTREILSTPEHLLAQRIKENEDARHSSLLRWVEESNNEQEKLFENMLIGASQLGYALEDAFDGKGKTLLSDFNRMLQVALRISDAMNVANKNDFDFGSVLGLGASFIPGLGFLTDLFSSSISIQPPGVTNIAIGTRQASISDELLQRVVDRVGALNNNMLESRPQPTNIKVFVGGEDLTNQVHIEENNMARSNTARSVEY